MSTRELRPQTEVVRLYPDVESDQTARPDDDGAAGQPVGEERCLPLPSCGIQGPQARIPGQRQAPTQPGAYLLMNGGEYRPRSSISLH